MQFALKAFAIAAIGVFKNGEFAFTIAAHDGDGVFQWQRFEVNRRDFLLTFFGQVALRARVNQLALQQEVACGIGVVNLGAVHAQLEHAGHGGAAHLVNRRDLRHPLFQGFANHGLFALCKGRRHTQGAQQTQHHS